ncbi:MMS19 nucleotide excision repair protein homolog [Tubulanus polymorphus]|uniref:MMS19 nucleotide excision repair protein homolog n=1 Tax=Tubulanus polymorphus TaxID=672921 RepID=UPI003DA41244
MAKADLEILLKNEDGKGIDRVTKDILQSKLTLVDLIESLGTHLTSEDVEIRKNGTKVLADILHRLPHDFIKESESELLCTFFLSRLKDHHSITPSILHGLNALSTFVNLPYDAPKKICQEIFREVQAQSLPQADRRSIYKLLSNFLNLQINCLQTLGSDFVFGFIQVMDGEKDPRNLSIAFNLVPKIINNFPIENFVEDLFEITSCYFPIDFNPPPNDPHGITREELILGLQNCMIATDKFAEYCYPLLLEKLSSDIPSSKLDSLHTLTAGAAVYGSKYLLEYINSIVGIIKAEVFAASSESLETASLNALTAITKTLTDDVKQVDHSSLNDFIQNIFKDCKRHLCEPEHKLVFPSGKLLHAIASASKTACEKISELSVPLLLEQFHKHLQANTRRNILSLIIGFIRISNQHQPDGFSIMRPYRDELLTIFLTLLSDINSQLRCLAITGMTGLAALHHMLSESEMSGVVDQILQKYLVENDVNVRQECITSLAFVGVEQPILIINRVLPVLEKQLQQGCKKSSSVEQSRVLSVIAAVSVHHQIIKSTVPLLLQSIKDNVTADVDISIIHETFESLLMIIRETSKDVKNLEYFSQTTFNELIALSSQFGCETFCLMSSADLIQLLANILQIIVKSSSDSERLLNHVLSMFTDDSSSSSKALELSSPVNKTRLVILLQAVVCAAPKQYLFHDVKKMFDKLTELSLCSPDNCTREIASKCLAGVINKLELDDSLELFINQIQERIKVQIAGVGDDLSSKSNAVNLWSWLSKSLIMRGHKKSTECIKIMIDILSDPSLGLVAANGFYVILHEYDDVLNKSLHSNIRLMYKQRFFVETLPKLTEGFHVAADDRKSSYLTALSYLLRYIPKQVLLSELPPLLPLMIQSLQGSSHDLHLSTMTTLHDLVFDAPDILAAQVDALIPLFLKLSSVQQSMKVRMLALQCLGVMSTLPYALLFPYQNRVIKELAKSLDDKKRLVRTEAVKARGEWFLLGTESK